MINLTINGKPVSLDVDPEMPILWVIREELQMTGTKFGCGIAACGACTVHLDGEPIRACSTPIEAAEGAEITTIEGLSDPDGALSKVQQAWIDAQVPQCGYCQSGQIMQAAQLIRENPKPSHDDIVAHMGGNLCRCMTYERIVAAIQSATA